MPRLVYAKNYEEKETFCEREIELTFLFRGSNAHPCLPALLWVCSTEPVSASLAFREGETSCWNMDMIYSDCTHHANLPFRVVRRSVYFYRLFTAVSISFLSVFVRASAFMVITTGSKAFN